LRRGPVGVLTCAPGRFLAVSRVACSLGRSEIAGDVVAVRNDRFAIPKTVVGAGIKVMFEDAAILVIDKPENLLSIASEAEGERTAYFQLTEYLRHATPNSKERVWIVHRLDRETSGLMVFAKTPEAKEFLQGGWDRTIKRYEAVVEGRVKGDSGTFESDVSAVRVKVLNTAPAPIRANRCVAARARTPSCTRT
jgi:23S rRNA-/tRNA-specific pseudouridylate synthase